MNNTELGRHSDRMLLFGGPYSNLAATEAMRAKAEALAIPATQIICTGDLVAYCAEPAETVELIRDWGIAVVMGNCEESLASNAADCGCGFDQSSRCALLARTWFQYANDRIGNCQRQWMAALPRSITFTCGGLDCRVVHGSVSSIHQFIFRSSPVAEKRVQLHAAQADVVIGGHSGIPFGQKIDRGYWLNAGVIGMPANDASPAVWYMLLDAHAAGFTASWHRLQYDYQRSRQSTQTAGMPAYAQALEDGLWPSMDPLPEPERRERAHRLELAPLRCDRPHAV